MLGDLIEYLSVFVASACNLNYGLGLSVTYDLTSFELFLLLSTGSIFGIGICLLLGAKFREWWRHRTNKRATDHSERQPGFLVQIWQRYGLLGLAFFTFLIGPLPPVTLALLSGMKKESIFLYLGAGKFLWSLVFAFLGYGQLQKVLAMIIQ